MNITTTISQYLEEQRALIDQELDQILPSEDTFPYSIHKAMRYSVFAGSSARRPDDCLAPVTGLCCASPLLWNWFIHIH